ncbi:hypothetical protein GCM10010492_18650 [Saccharothrix mutabilis subsp. mutabilis]|uniref:Uncharacterized protein n=1 Tax=Saccharothrix mutabilis subsp. mutabilis TaxID=66855 RepID=A0ABN0TG24_9PSEU
MLGHGQQIDFLGAHGVVYNDGRLWALGYESLRQYDIRENSLKEASPRITKFWAGGARVPAPLPDADGVDVRRQRA